MNKISQTIPLQCDSIFSPFRAAESDAALDFLAKAKFTGVEIAVASPCEIDVDALLKKLDICNLTATTISTGQAYVADGLYLSSFDTDVRNKAIEIIKGHVDLSAQIGYPPVTIGLLRGKLEKGEKVKLLENLRLAIIPCFEYAQKRGVTLQIEPICQNETILINTTYEAIEFLELLGNPQNAGILYDTYHSNIEDDDMVKAVLAAGKRITNVHLADSHRGLPGYGGIDFAAVVRALRSVGYNGAYALETLVTPNKEFINEHCYESVINIEGIIKAGRC